MLSQIEQKFDVKVLWHPFSSKAAGQSVQSLPSFDRISYIMEDAQRISRKQGIPLTFPEGWPGTEFNPDKMTRGAFVASDLGMVVEYNVKVFSRWWDEGQDPNEQDFFVELCADLDVDPNEFAGRVNANDTRERVKGAFKRGRKLHVYDTPTILIDEERFVGIDRIAAVEERLTTMGLKKVVRP